MRIMIKRMIICFAAFWMAGAELSGGEPDSFVVDVNDPALWSTAEGAVVSEIASPWEPGKKNIQFFYPGYVEGSMNRWAAAVIGAVAACVCYGGIIFMRGRKDVDDALDVMGVHGLGGIWGAIAVGLFSVSQYSWVGMGGLIEGGWQLLAGQLVSVAVTLLYCFVVSFVLMKLLDTVSRKVTGKGAALSESEQMIGADVIEHGESSYVM